jgi:hypothetical protein
MDFGDGSDKPITTCPEAVLGQQEASQLQFNLRNERKVHWGNIRLVGRVLNRLYAFAAI